MIAPFLVEVGHKLEIELVSTEMLEILDVMEEGLLTLKAVMIRYVDIFCETFINSNHFKYV